MDKIFMFVVKAGIVLGIVGGAICATIASEWNERQRDEIS